MKSLRSINRNLIIVLAVAAAVVIVFFIILQPGSTHFAPNSVPITIGELADMIDDPVTREAIVSITVQRDSQVNIVMTNGRRYQTAKDPISSLPSQLRSMGITDSDLDAIRGRIQVADAEPDLLVNLIIIGVPAVLVVAMLFQAVRKNMRFDPNSQSNPINQMKKTPVTEQMGFRAITFDHVGGYEPAKQALRELTSLLREPAKRQAMSIRIPSGILLTGAPGSGKTQLAQAAAGDVGLNLLCCNGSDFIDMFVGVGANRIREIFGKARKAAPAILILDQIDALGFKRLIKPNNGEDERLQTLAALLTELDNVTANQGILVIAITNRPDALDEALTRSGRLERVIHLNAPDSAERESILRVLTARHSLSADVRLSALAEMGEGMVGAQLEQWVNEAGLRAIHNNSQTIGEQDFLSALSTLKTAQPASASQS